MGREGRNEKSAACSFYMPSHLVSWFGRRTRAWGLVCVFRPTGIGLLRHAGHTKLLTRAQVLYQIWYTSRLLHLERRQFSLLYVRLNPYG